MKALATWSPAPYLNVTAVEREGARWLVTVCSGERACCPLVACNRVRDIASTHARLAISPLRGHQLRSGFKRVAGAAGTSGAIAGSSPNAFRELRARSRVRLTA
jgi:hypothetical protein